MKSKFCTTIVKEENRGLTLVNHRHQSRNSIFKKSFDVQR